MTCIAYKNGFLVSDSEIHEGRLRVGHARKIIRCKDGSIAGAAGDLKAISAFLKWAKNGFKDKSRPDFESSDFVGLVISKDETITFYENGFLPSVLDAPFHAIGSGQWVAIGAMAAGASAQKAVEIACQYIHGCSGPLQIEALNI